ncbi:MAG: prolyl oligopeptidase family serine peptidase [Candidatus Levybacteria bacterium]|nr:prolyl oligopeptidase family serine peptidase [Candidatus Levybacteria bacterium]
MRKLGIGIILLLLILGIFIFSKNITFQKEKVKEKPLLKYTFANLKKTKFQPHPIALGISLDEKENYISQMFYYTIRDVIGGENKEKKVSGLINIPRKEGTYPVVIMIRGFVPIETYATGIGTKRAGEVFAENGFITLAPDFLGYGESDNPEGGSIEERLQTYTAVLTLLSSLNNLNSGLTASYSGKIKADVSRVGIWGHSNGGHIAISILEITGKNYPTVLWAPVSKPFPYSILYFTDDIADHGKALRKVVAEFENDYDIELYSPSNFYSWINASIEIHQGTADDAVPLKWSDQLVSDLKKLEKNVTYFTYPGADHNLLPASPQGGPDWGTAVQRSLDFYKSHL